MRNMLSLLALATLVLSFSGKVLAEEQVPQGADIQTVPQGEKYLAAQRDGFWDGASDEEEERSDIELFHKEESEVDNEQQKGKQEIKNLDSEDSFEHKEHSKDDGEHKEHNEEIVYLKPDGQWHKFIFGKAGTEVEQRFVFTLRNKAFLDITDYYCPGDSFRLYDNGVCIGRTPLKRANECKDKTADPQVAFKSDKWSHRSFELGKGKHIITIKVVRSPYCGGAGAIRLNPILYTCLESQSSESCHSESSEKLCESSSSSSRCSESSSSSDSSSSCSSSDKPPHKPCGEFTVITSKVPFCEAADACRALGLRLANLTNDNFLRATEAAFRCSGDFSQTWIKSWYGNDYDKQCLVLSTGASAPGGAINVPNCCDIELPVLCQSGHDGDKE